MAISQQLLSDPSVRLMGFTGGKGRNYLLNQLASELAHIGKKVVITHLDREILAPSGFILYQKNEKKLIREIEREIFQNPIIFAATDIQDHMVTGISIDTLLQLKNIPAIDAILVILGDEKINSILSREEIDTISELKSLDELIYAFQLDLIDQQLAPQMLDKLPGFMQNSIKKTPGQSFSQELLIEYLTDRRHGAFNLFQQLWPTYLIFTDITNILLENRCITIARDLHLKKIQHIFQSHLREKIVKRIPLG